MELRSLEDAKTFYSYLFVPPESIEERAAKIAEEIFRAISRVHSGYGHSCPHFGGDYWIKVGTNGFFCNIAPHPDDMGRRGHSHYNQTVAEFLFERNTFIQDAIDYFSR